MGATDTEKNLFPLHFQTEVCNERADADGCPLGGEACAV